MQTHYLNFIKRLLFVVLMAFLSLSFTLLPGKPIKKVTVIVIDAGHGGKDPGCSGVHSKEKEVTLAVALKLGKLIEEKLKDVKVVYTRKTDVFVELEERAQIANRNNADLFISIHCNAASKIEITTIKGKQKKKEVINPKPYGSETYVMGIKNESGKTNVMKRENAVMLLEDNYKTTYGGFDPNSDESYIMMSMFTETFVEQSGKFASLIQHEYKTKSGRIDKGVKRESLWVLWRTKMPSVLTEIGYLTNPSEENFIASDQGQYNLAASLFRAFRNYKNDIEGTGLKFNDEIENLNPLNNENVAKGDTSYLHQIEDYQNDEDTLDMSPAEKIKSLLADGNRLFAQGDFDSAEKKYKEILILDAKHKEATQKTGEIKSVRNKYSAVISKADKLFEEKKFEQAKQIYADAQVILPKEKYPTAQINRCNSALSPNENISIEKEFESHLKNANTFFTGKKFQDALSSFELAQKVKPNDSLVARKIKQCRDSIQEISNVKNGKYSLLIIEGDSFFRLGKYEEAKSKYREAALTDPLDEYPKQKLNEISELQNINTAKSCDYTCQIKKADSAYAALSYTLATEYYKQALAVKPNDDYATFQLDLISKIAEWNNWKISILNQIRQADSLHAIQQCGKAIPLYQKSIEAIRNSARSKEKIAVDTASLQKKLSGCLKEQIIVKNNLSSRTTKSELRVQFRQSDKKIQLNHPDFSGLMEVWSYEMNGMFKYTSGKFLSLEEANRYKEALRQKGFKDAFVIGVSEGKRIDIQKAVELILQEKNQ